MPLSEDQKKALAAEAERRGIDPAKLIAAAEKSKQTTTAPKKGAAVESSGAPPNLYIYHLPFVTVNEVRTIWLKLEPVAGGEQYAGEWAAQRGAAVAEPKPSDE